MTERKTDEWGTWERTPGSRNGWYLVPGTETPLFEEKRTVPDPEPTPDQQEYARIKAVLEKDPATWTAAEQRAVTAALANTFKRKVTG